MKKYRHKRNNQKTKIHSKRKTHGKKKHFAYKEPKNQKENIENRKEWIIKGIISYKESLKEKGFNKDFCNLFEEQALWELNTYKDKSDEEIPVLLQDIVKRVEQEFKKKKLDPKETKIKASKRKLVLNKFKKVAKKGIVKTKEILKEAQIKNNINKQQQIKKKLLKELDERFTREVLQCTEELLRRFNYPQISALGRIKKIPDMKSVTIDGKYGPYEKKARREFDDYVNDLICTATFEEVLNFALKEGVRDSHEFRHRFKDITTDYTQQNQKIEKDISEKIKQIKGEEIEEDLPAKLDEDNLLFKEIIEEIQEFEMPISPHIQGELPYHLTLYGWLKKTFKAAEIERQIGSSRPDIVIEDIAIEVKGPTYHQDLQTIADKAMRYSRNFRGGLIIVLFNVQVYERFYNEWLTALTEQHPKIVIIRK